MLALRGVVIVGNRNTPCSLGGGPGYAVRCPTKTPSRSDRWCVPAQASSAGRLDRARPGLYSALGSGRLERGHRGIFRGSFEVFLDRFPDTIRDRQTERILISRPQFYLVTYWQPTAPHRQAGGGYGPVFVSRRVGG